MELVLIPCSQKKRDGGASIILPFGFVKNYLSTSSYLRYIELLRKISKYFNERPGSDFGFHQNESGIQLLPADERYSGNIYKKGEVITLYPKTEGVKILIVSALYGLVDADEPIRKYNISMSCKIGSKKVKTWWKNNNLGSIVGEVIKNHNPNLTHDLLSGDYRNALNPWPPNWLKENYCSYDYSGNGMGSNWKRGDDLREILSRNIN